MTQPRHYNIYADGGVINQNPSPYGGVWAWCMVTPLGVQFNIGSGIVLASKAQAPQGDAEMVETMRLEYPTIENNVMEVIACVNALAKTEEGSTITLHSDNKNALQRICGTYQWNGVPLAIRQQCDELKKTRTITPVLLKGHPPVYAQKAGHWNGKPVSVWNVWCDNECKKVAQMYLHNHILIQSPPDSVFTGSKDG